MNDHECPDFPAPCNCDNSTTHNGHRGVPNEPQIIPASRDDITRSLDLARQHAFRLRGQYEAALAQVTRYEITLEIMAKREDHS